MDIVNTAVTSVYMGNDRLLIIFRYPTGMYAIVNIAIWGPNPPGVINPNWQMYVAERLVEVQIVGNLANFRDDFTVHTPILNSQIINQPIVNFRFADYQIPQDVWNTCLVLIGPM
jgi:hypothetical protein